MIVALVGFWDWRAALLMAASIPLTLALTFGIVQVLGIDIQQVSIATLIIALGLLVDMPVVAGDAIKRELGQGSPRSLAAWIGPTKLAKAIIFATITNIVAYLPFLLLTGDTYFFLYSLPVVMSVTLVASVIVSFTFIPLLAYYLIKPPKQVEEPMSERRKHGFAGLLLPRRRLRAPAPLGGVRGLAEHPGRGLARSCRRLHPQFFPKDLSYLSYVDVWLPEDAPLAATNAVAHKAEAVIREEAERFGEEHHAEGRPEVAHHVRRRRRARGSGSRSSPSAAAQLRPDHRRGERQALHQRAGRPAADRAQPRGARGADRRPAARDGQAGRHPGLDPHLGRRHGRPAPALERAAGDLPRAARARAGCATTGASRR